MSPDLQGYVAVVDRCIDRSVMKAFEDHPLIVLSTLVSTLSSFSGTGTLPYKEVLCGRSDEFENGLSTLVISLFMQSVWDGDFAL